MQSKKSIMKRFSRREFLGRVRIGRKRRSGSGVKLHLAYLGSGARGYG